MISHQAFIAKAQEFGLLEQQPLSSELFSSLSLWEKGLGEDAEPERDTATNNTSPVDPSSQPSPQSERDPCSRLRTRF
jgi:hypothetical protein